MDFAWAPATCLQPDWCHDPVLKQPAEQRNGVSATDTISVCFQEMGGAWNITTGWTPQQYDLFAEDWMEWQDQQTGESIDNLPKAGSMDNCDKLSNSINQLLDTVTCLPNLNAYVEPGPNNKELTITIREEKGPAADSVPVHVGCTFHITHHNIIGCRVINPDAITKSSIGSPVKSTKPVTGGYGVEYMQSSFGEKG